MKMRTVTDHAAHVELFYEIWLDFARGQLAAMDILKDQPSIQANIDKITPILKEVESKLETVQNRDEND